MGNNRVAVPKFRFCEPKINLPTHKHGVASAEDRFASFFARTYRKQACRIHRGSSKTCLALVREIPVNGYGITDLLAVAWTELPEESFPSGEAFAIVAKPTCRAFEMKLTNWQKALSQASRYRNFAHQTIVVLPPHACKNASVFLDTFISVGVGLWSFDQRTNKIVAHFTPRPHKPRSSKYLYESLKKASRTTNSSLPICETV